MKVKKAKLPAIMRTSRKTPRRFRIGEKQVKPLRTIFRLEFDRLVQLDQEWRDHFAQSNVPIRQSAEDEEKRQFMFDSLAAGTSLTQMLMDQMRETDLTEEQRGVAELIIGNIDDYGYLKATVEELSASTNLPEEKISEVLKVIQTFDPPGVGAHDLRECLLLQLERAGRQDSLEYRIVRDYMDALGKRRIPEIARGTGRTVEEVQEALGRIGRLEPRPGRAFLPDTDQYILPEVFVQKVGNDFVVTTNNEHIPHLHISNVYKDIMSQGGNSAEVKNYIREKIRAGKFLIKSLHQRQQTILNIAKEIVKRQREFMEKGVAHLKPMTMAQVAEVVGVHETTVSRAVSGKYMQTPQGVFEMKFFFTAGLQTASGDGRVQCQRQRHDRRNFQRRRHSQAVVGSGSRENARATKASPSRAGPSPNTAPNSTSCRRICARFIEPVSQPPPSSPPVVRPIAAGVLPWFSGPSGQ